MPVFALSQLSLSLNTTACLLDTHRSLPQQQKQQQDSAAPAPPPPPPLARGEEVDRAAAGKTHFCVTCRAPIAVYGRLVPCRHAYCLSCATDMAQCFMCVCLFCVRVVCVERRDAAVTLPLTLSLLSKTHTHATTK